MEFLDIVIRCTISALTLFILARMMGKKQIAHLNVFDYVVGITIGSIAGTFSVDNSIKYWHGIVAIIIWGSFSLMVSFISLKSMRGRRILASVPSILVQNGKIVEQNLRNQKFTVNDLLEELRIKGVFNIADVEFAILETNGQISTQLKSQVKPVTPSDLKISTGYRGLPANLIIDGEIMYEHLKQVSLDENWLLDELKKRNIGSPSLILLASLDSGGNLYISMKDQRLREHKVLE